MHPKNESSRVPSRRTRTTVLVLLLISTATAWAGEWTNREHVQFRLSLDEVTHEASTANFIELAIRLDAGWQFYAENPGEFGLPPRFDWSKSSNVAAVSILWPEPTRTIYSDDPPISTLGYKDSVFLPIRVTREKTEQLSHIHLTLDYSICDEYCISDRVELQKVLLSQEPKEERSRTMPTSWSGDRQ